MKLYLIPTPIASGTPEINVDIIASIDYFIVENIRTTRRYISSLKLGRAIETLDFVEFSEHTPAIDVDAIIAPIIAGRNGAIMSEAGLPCVADPGNIVVRAAHKAGIEIIPLVGQSSIMLALMASGANGQNFAFNGYLPIKNDARTNAIKHFVRRAVTENQTQIFIETPYRNASLMADLINTCPPEISLTIAADILAPTQLIATKTVAAWRQCPMPNINKKPTIFILSPQ